MHYSQPELTLREALLADSAQSWETEALAHSRGWQSMGSLACTAGYSQLTFTKDSASQRQLLLLLQFSWCSISSLKLVRHTRGRWHSLVPLWLCTCTRCWAKKTYFAESAQRTWNPCFNRKKWVIMKTTNQWVTSKQIHQNQMQPVHISWVKLYTVFWVRGSFYLLTYVNVSHYRTSMII